MPLAKTGLLFAIAATCSLSAPAGDWPVQAETLFSEDFEGEELPLGWIKGDSCPGSLAKGEGVDGGNCIKFKVEPGKELRGGLLSFELPLEKFRGKAVVAEAMVKGVDVSRGTPHYLGPKLMFHFKSPDGERWVDALKLYGSYGWRKTSVFVRLPENLQSVDIALGLQGASGAFWIDKLKITAIPLLPMPAAGKVSNAKLQSKPSLRGMMSGGDLSEAALKAFGQDWNANLLRFQLSNPKRAELSTSEKVDAWLKPHLERLEQTLPLCRKYGVKVAIDLHAGPGATQDEVLGNHLSWSKSSQDELVRVWRLLATKFKDEPAVWGYDLLNEPSEESYTGENLDWNRLAEHVAKAIREIDPEKPIIVEPVGGAVESLKTFVPLSVPNVIYSIHFYEPAELTHQGIYGRQAGIAYPGVIGGKAWDKKAIEKALAPAVEFQRKYKVPIYVGEFSVARWAPGESGARWLRDVIEVFESHGWDWSYHAFREADCWDAEIGSAKDDKVRLERTPRKDLLLEYFKRNVKSAPLQ